MRGLYYMWLTQLYGDVPLIISTTITDEMQQEVSAEEAVFPQILSDFVSAKNLLKAERANGSGHADKFAAEAFIARAWMFWAGFYKKVSELANGDATITLVEQEGCNGGSLSKADVVTCLKDIVSNGGYKLCEDFRSLWQYSNSLLWDEAHDGKGHAYEFIADMDRKNCFDQPGMGVMVLPMIMVSVTRPIRSTRVGVRVLLPSISGKTGQLLRLLVVIRTSVNSVA